MRGTHLGLQRAAAALLHLAVALGSQFGTDGRGQAGDVEAADVQVVAQAQRQGRLGSRAQPADQFDDGAYFQTNFLLGIISTTVAAFSDYVMPPRR
jgi:hypothetical protein